MPIAVLFVEGNLESELLNPIFEGMPTLKQGGSKNGLRPRVRTERQENKIEAGYLRDRDFDFDPPNDLSKPTVDDPSEGLIPIGWRWCRHEIENYLLEPALIHACTGWPEPEIEEAICETARQIRYYEAARWTVGKVRRELPPHFKLKTRPDNLNEIALPSALRVEYVKQWAIEHVNQHHQRIVTATNSQRVEQSFDDFVMRFNDSFVSTVSNVLLEFSGKDIFAGLATWLSTRNKKGITTPGEFRAALRSWVIGNPEQALNLLPEWQRLVEIVRS